MSKLEEAKKLLKNALATNDSELIAMANNLLEQENHKPPKPDTSRNLVNRDDDEFLSPIIQPESTEQKRGGVPVNEITNRSNSFHDDGTEAKDILTPSIPPTDRKRRPYKPIEQKCQKCDKVVTINPAHKREFFVCDKCLGK